MFADCEKAKVRGHKCSFRVKLTMRLGFVDHWFVEVLGSHNSFKDEANSPATSTISDGKQTEAADYSANALDNASASPSSETSDDLLLQRDSPVSEVASLLRQNGASAAAAAAAALCEQFRSSPPILYLSPASHLNIPVFPEPFSISAQHHRRHQHHQAVAAAAVLGTSQPQVSSLDLRIKPDPESAATTTASVHIKPDPESAATTTASDIDIDSPMELTTKGSSASTPTKNGHAVLSHKEGSSWSERNELLKSYMSSDPAQSNGGGGTSGGESYTTRKYCQLGSPNSSSSKKYWTYQFSAPELTPTPSPMGSEDVEDRTIIDDTEDETEGCLVIDDDAEVTEHGDVDDEYEKVPFSGGVGKLLEWIIPSFCLVPSHGACIGNTACACSVCVAFALFVVLSPPIQACFECWLSSVGGHNSGVHKFVQSVILFHIFLFYCFIFAFFTNSNLLGSPMGFSPTFLYHLKKKNYFEVNLLEMEISFKEDYHQKMYLHTPSNYITWFPW